MMSRNDAQSSARAGGRRRFPRIQLDGELKAFDTTLGSAVPITDISFGGLQTISPSPVVPLTEHHFRVILGRGSTYKLRATAAHCHSLGDSAPYVIGWQLSKDFETAQAITEIIDYLTNAASFESSATPSVGKASQL